MALVGWLFKCYRKCIYIRGAQIVVASASKFCVVASDIFSIIIADFFLTKVCNSSHAPNKVLAMFAGYSRIVSPMDGT